MIVEFVLESDVTTRKYAMQLRQLTLVCKSFSELMLDHRKKCSHKHMTTHYKDFYFGFTDRESWRRLNWISTQSEFSKYVESLTIEITTLFGSENTTEDDEWEEEWEAFLIPEAFGMMRSMVSENLFQRVLPLLPNLKALVIDQHQCAEILEKDRKRVGQYKALLDNIASSAHSWNLEKLNILGVDNPSPGIYAKPMVAHNGTQFITALNKSRLTKLELSTWIQQDSTIPEITMSMETDMQTRFKIGWTLHGSCTQQYATSLSPKPATSKLREPSWRLPWFCLLGDILQRAQAQAYQPSRDDRSLLQGELPRLPSAEHARDSKDFAPENAHSRESFSIP
jgi:hypothetical protein